MSPTPLLSVTPEKSPRCPPISPASCVFTITAGSHADPSTDAAWSVTARFHRHCLPLDPPQASCTSNSAGRSLPLPAGTPPSGSLLPVTVTSHRTSSQPWRKCCAGCRAPLARQGYRGLRTRPSAFTSLSSPLPRAPQTPRACAPARPPSSTLGRWANSSVTASLRPPRGRFSQGTPTSLLPGACAISLTPSHRHLQRRDRVCPREALRRRTRGSDAGSGRTLVLSPAVM